MTTVTDPLRRGVDAALTALERRFTMTSALAAFFIVNAQVALLGTYVLVGRQRITDWVPILLPFVWINVSLAAIHWTDVSAGATRDRVIASLVAVGYFIVLAYAGGLVGAGSTAIPSYVDLELVSLPPGWAPALGANVPPLRFAVVFYEVVGYLALAYLVYGTVLETATSAIGGVVGLLSCVSCNWPIIAGVLTGVFGSGTGIAAAAQNWTYSLSTLIFLVTVLLLYYRPGFDRLAAVVSR